MKIVNLLVHNTDIYG